MDAADPRRRRRLVPVVQRARRGQRPREPLDTRREERGRVPRDRSEGVVVVRDLRRHGHRARCAPTPSAPPHKGISMLAIPMDAKGVDVRPLRQMTGEQRVQRGLPRRRRGAGREPHRSGARGLAGRQHDARQRAGRVVHLEGAGAARGRDRPARGSVRPPRVHRRSGCAAAARAVVDRRRDLPPAQRAHARPARTRSRRSARSRAS